MHQQVEQVVTRRKTLVHVVVIEMHGWDDLEGCYFYMLWVFVGGGGGGGDSFFGLGGRVRVRRLVWAEIGKVNVSEVDIGDVKCTSIITSRTAFRRCSGTVGCCWTINEDIMLITK